MHFKHGLHYKCELDNRREQKNTASSCFPGNFALSVSHTEKHEQVIEACIRPATQVKRPKGSESSHTRGACQYGVKSRQTRDEKDIEE